MIRGPEPICCECALRQDVVEPFSRAVGQLVRCKSCGVQLVVRRIGDSWEVRTMVEHKRQRTAPLPAVGPLRARIGRACADAIAFLTGGAPEPGESSLQASMEEHSAP